MSVSLINWDLFHAVVFDCDDTVIATAKTRWAALQSAAERFGHGLAEDTIRASWGKPFNELIADLVPGVDLQRFTATYRDVMRGFAPSPTLGALELLMYLRSKNKRMDILTSSSEPLIRQDLDALSLTDFFTMIWGYERTAPFHKPDARVFEPVLKTLQNEGIERDFILYVGDSIRDYQVAQGNHLTFIAVASGIETHGDLSSSGVPEGQIVDSLFALVPGMT